MIVMETIEICYCGGYVPLSVTMCHGLSSCVLLWINTVVFYQLTCTSCHGDYPVG
jgi:hypothetical protein